MRSTAGKPCRRRRCRHMSVGLVAVASGDNHPDAARESEVLERLV
jgi:hypothetical protein